MNCLDFGGLRGLPGGGDARTWGNRHEAGCGAAVCRGDMLATRLHRSPLAADSASAGPEAVWVEVPAARSVACDLVVDGTRLVVASAVRQRRDDTRRAQLIARTEAQLLAPGGTACGSDGLRDPANIGSAATRILSASGIARVFEVEIARDGSSTTTTRRP